MGGYGMSSSLQQPRRIQGLHLHGLRSITIVQTTRIAPFLPQGFAARSFSKSPYIVHSHTFYIASRGDLAEKLLLLIGIAPTGTEVHNDLGARERTNLKRQSNIFSRVESSLQRFLTETEGRGKMT